MSRFESIAFWILVAANLVPIWFLPAFPSQDGPIHVSIAMFLERLGDPAHPVLDGYLRHSDAIEPNSFVYLLLYPLTRIMAPEVAEQAFLSLFAVAMPLAARYAITAMNGSQRGLAVLLVPFVTNQFLHFGFYNFCWSMAWFLVGFGTWYRYRGAMTPTRWAILVALGLGTVLTHLVGFLTMLIAIGGTRTGDLVGELARRESGAWRRYLGHATGLLAAYAPGMAIAVFFFLRNPIESGVAPDFDKARLLINLGALAPLFTFSRDEILLGLPLIALTWGLGAHMGWRRLRARRLERGDAVLAGFAALVAVYLFVPLTARGVPASERLVPFLLYTFVLWIGTGSLGRRARGWVIAVATLTALVLGADRLRRYADLRPFVDDYLSCADAIEPQSSILALHYWDPDRPLDGVQRTWQTDPILHLASRLAVQRDGVDLSASLLSPAVFGYFPIKYRAELDPYELVGGALEFNPPEAHLERAAAAGLPIDYVVTFALEDADPGDAWVGRVRGELERDYEIVFRSRLGLTLLWRRR